MMKGHKFSLSAVLAFVLLFAIGSGWSLSANAQVSPPVRDTLKLPTPTSGADTPRRQRRDTSVATVETFSLRLSKDSLTAPVQYEAEDSAVAFVVDKTVFLYGKTRTQYDQLIVKAPSVVLDQKTTTISARGARDSTGYMVEQARFEQGTEAFDADEFVYNWTTEKGITEGTRTKSGEMFVQAEQVKKTGPNTQFLKRAQFTTCNLDHPHFAFRAGKMKLINNKLAITGPVHPEFEGVPIPIYLPFGFYPLTQNRHSGFIAPRFSVTENVGVGLEGFGYYQVFNDYWDVRTTATIYSYGGWNLQVAPSYRTKYRYNGRFNLSIQSNKTAFKGDPDFTSQKSFNLAWSHAIDNKARPGVTFQASVNAGSTQYNKNVINAPLLNFQNRQNSSISYSKTWLGTPFSLQLAMAHSQNNSTQVIDLTLPNGSFSMNSIFPFEKKERTGPERWYEKLGVGYNNNFQSLISFVDTTIGIKSILDTLTWRIDHSIPINLTLPSLGPILVSPNISYSEEWGGRAYDRSWNPTAKRVDTVVQRGFYTARRVSMGISLNTAVFGTYRMGKRGGIEAFRHVVRPTASLSYTPDLARGYNQLIQQDTFGTMAWVNRYSASRIGTQRGKFGGITFGIDNNLEMKLRNRRDSGAKEPTKVRLIDALSINSGYNFLEDSFQLLPFTVQLRSTLLDKVNLNFSTYLDPYNINEAGQRINSLAVGIADGFRLGRVTNAQLSLSTQFRSKKKEGKSGTETPVNPGAMRSGGPINRDFQRNGMMEDQMLMQDYMRRNPAEFVDFDLPWEVSLDVSALLTRFYNVASKRFQNQITSNLNFRGSFSLTEKWNFTANGAYDLRQTDLQLFTMSINRDMHCWQMAISVTPVGPWRSFSFTISPKSALLQDLKVNRTRTFTDF